MLKLAILTIAFLIGPYNLIGQSTEKAVILKFSTIDLLLGDHCTKSWSSNLIVEKSFKRKYSFQQEIGLIFPDHFIDKSFFFIPTDRLWGIRLNPEVKKYVGRPLENDVLKGLNLGLDCNTVFTKATESISEASIRRLVVAPHLKLGFQSISSKRFVFEFSIGLGPGFVFSKSSIAKADLESRTYHYGILYEGGSGVYLSCHFDFKLGYLIKM